MFLLENLIMEALKEKLFMCLKMGLTSKEIWSTIKQMATENIIHLKWLI